MEFKTKKILILLIVICSSAINAITQTNDVHWFNLFNGKNLDGWEQKDGAAN